MTIEDCSVTNEMQRAARRMTNQLIDELNTLLIEAAGSTDIHRKWNIINHEAQSLFSKIKNHAWHEWVEAMNKERKK
jgi:hypothetical protein